MTTNEISTSLFGEYLREFCICYEHLNEIKSLINRDHVPMKLIFALLKETSNLLNRHCYPESKIFKEFLRIQDQVLEILADRHRDKHQWIDYFYHECDCGKRPGLAIIDGVEYKIDSVDSLLEVMRVHYRSKEQ